LPCDDAFATTSTRASSVTKKACFLPASIRDGYHPRKVLAFGRLWYAELNAVSNAISYAKFYSRSHDAVIRVYDEAGNVIAPLRTAFLFCLPRIN
jgi:hypothetical protein